jgi:hypothetical protein
MRRARPLVRSTVLILPALLAMTALAADSFDAPPGWDPAAPREELRPWFAYVPKGGVMARGPSSSRTIAARVANKLFNGGYSALQDNVADKNPTVRSLARGLAMSFCRAL